MRYRIIAPLAIAAAAWAVTSGSAQAQTWRSDARLDIPRAIELEREAAVANTDRRRWSQAASMFHQASRLRPANDPVALMDLRTAGAIYGTTGRLDRARSTLLELADRATVFGEIEVAAHALVDVAHVAVRLGDFQSVRRYYERAQRLAASSHLTPEEQTRLGMRFEPAPTLLAASRR